MNPLFTALQTPVVSPRFSAQVSKNKSLLRGVSRILGNTPSALLAKEILPALTIEKDVALKFHTNAMTTLSSCSNALHVKFSANKNLNLDGIAISSGDKPLAERKIVVYFLPNYMLWEEKIEDFLAFSDRLEADVVCYNYRGCGQSSGFPNDANDLVADGLSQLQQLLDAGAKPENIVLYGYSLGGGISMQVAEALAKANIPVNIVNERSFSSIDAVLKTTKVFGERIAAQAIKSLGWNLSSETALQELHGNVLIIDNPHDEVIEAAASLRSALDSKSYPNKDKIHVITMKKTKTEDQHDRAWTKAETEAIFQAISKLWTKKP